MTQGTASLLRRIVRPAAPPPTLTPARALRLAMTRAAERSVALPLSVLGVSEEEGPLDDLLARLEEGLMILSLYEGGDPVGLVALDTEARAATVEVQALGSVSPVPSDPRPVTAADAALARPLLAALLSEVEQATAGTTLSGWLRGPRLDARLPGAREATMLLPEGPYRVVRLTLDLGTGGRQGLVVLMLRLPRQDPDPEDSGRIAPPTVAPHVLGSQAVLDAVLHRVHLPLAEAEALEVGQLLPLPGVTVASIRIVAGGSDLGSGRLGQVAGMRAIRIEEPLSPRLEELPTLSDPSTPARLPGSVP